MKRDIRIAISGKSGCGNTTVSKIVADQLGLRFINFTFRSLAKERDISFEEILNLAKNDDSWDREVDTRQVQLARENGGCVLGSRLAVWMLEDADLKVYLTAKPETRAARITLREGKDFRAVMDFTAERDRQDSSRYLHLYNINNNIYDFVDLVIDTDYILPEKIAQLIIEAAEKTA